MNDFSRTMSIECPVADAFDALTLRVPQWWSRDFEGRTDMIGAEFTVKFDDTFKTMRVVELEPCSKVTWSCVASHLDLPGLRRPSEWDETRIEWTLRSVSGGTILTVTHVGLTPALSCLHACERGWDHFLTNSLASLLEDGEGRPFLASGGARRGRVDSLMTVPIAATAMLIRRPPADCFRAFTEPSKTIRFWFTASSGRLTPGARVNWTWGMYGITTEVEVQTVEPDRRILITWDNTSEPTEVEWRFEPRGDATWVTVENRGFAGTAEERTAKALDSTGGFALVLAGAKIWLEHGIDPRFIVDRHPDHIVKGWAS